MRLPCENVHILTDLSGECLVILAQGHKDKSEQTCGNETTSKSVFDATAIEFQIEVMNSNDQPSRKSQPDAGLIFEDEQQPHYRQKDIEAGDILSEFIFPQSLSEVEGGKTDQEDNELRSDPTDRLSVNQSEYSFSMRQDMPKLMESSYPPLSPSSSQTGKKATVSRSSHFSSTGASRLPELDDEELIRIAYSNSTTPPTVVLSQYLISTTSSSIPGSDYSPSSRTSVLNKAQGREKPHASLPSSKSGTSIPKLKPFLRSRPKTRYRFTCSAPGCQLSFIDELGLDTHCFLLHRKTRKRRSHALTSVPTMDPPYQGSSSASHSTGSNEGSEETRRTDARRVKIRKLEDGAVSIVLSQNSHATEGNATAPERSIPSTDRADIVWPMKSDEGDVFNRQLIHCDK